MTAQPRMNASWWHCTHESAKQAQLDALCQQGHDAGCRVAVLAMPEQLISNLTVQENISLPAGWFRQPESADPNIHNAINHCLQQALHQHETVSHLLGLQGARLNAWQRRWVGLARTLHSQANWLVIEDDETTPDPFTDERLAILQQYLPQATVHWVSLRKPVALPAAWQTGTTE